MIWFLSYEAIFEMIATKKGIKIEESDPTLGGEKNLNVGLVGQWKGKNWGGCHYIFSVINITV